MVSLLEAAVLDQIDRLPVATWVHGDDLCDCTFQRIGQWTNPYLGKTLRVRICCIWAEIYKQYPQFVQEIDGYYDDNRNAFDPDPIPWNSEDEDMPVHLWHRQLAIMAGKSLDEGRAEYRGQLPPVKISKTEGDKDAIIR